MTVCEAMRMEIEKKEQEIRDIENEMSVRLSKVYKAKLELIRRLEEMPVKELEREAI